MQRFTYQLGYDEASYTVVGYEGDEEAVRVPESFLGKPVTILFDKLFAGHEELKEIYTRGKKDLPM